MLDDYAQIARASLMLLSVTGNERYMVVAKEAVKTVERLFLDEKAGGYFFTPSNADQLIARTRTAMDNATPAGNGVIAEVLARLYHLTGEDKYRERAEGIIKAFTGVPPEQFAHLASTGNAFEILANATQVVVIAEPDSAAARTMISAAVKAGDPNLVLRCLAPANKLSSPHPAAGKTQQGGKPTTYVCRGTVCGPPITSAANIASAMAAI